MNERGKSDKPVVPRKSANTGGAKPLMVEWMEGRGLARGNPNQQNESRTQCREAADKENPKRARSGKPRIQPRGDTCLRSHDSHSALDRVREAAQRDKGLRFTTLWHHVYDVERLRKAYRELKKDAERFQTELRERFCRFNLELHADKTRLIEFGRYAAERRSGRGEGKPGTFNFLGFTHICGKDRRGRFVVLRQTIRQRMRAKLKQVKETLRRRMHAPIREVGGWLRSVVNGYYRYFAVPRNYPALQAFRFRVIGYWRQTLRRRSQKNRITWERMKSVAQRWIPTPRIVHPYPEARLIVRT